MSTMMATLRKAKLACLKIFVVCLSFVIFTISSLPLLFERFAITTIVYANNLSLSRLVRASLQELWGYYVRIRYRSDYIIESTMRYWSWRTYIVIGCTRSRLERRPNKRRSKRIIQWAMTRAIMSSTMRISKCKARRRQICLHLHLHRDRFYKSRSLPSSRLRVVREKHRIVYG